MFRKPKIYISAPITGYNLKERRKAFARWAQVLVDAGCEPVNPMGKGLPDEASYEEHMRKDISLLLDCDGYVLSTLWLSSKGCKCEVMVAQTCGLRMVGHIKNDNVILDMSEIDKIKERLK